MDKKYGKYIVIGWFISVIIGQIIRHNRQKKELEETEKINKLIEDFGDRLMKSVHESTLKTQIEADRIIKNTIEKQSETEEVLKRLEDDNNSIQCD